MSDKEIEEVTDYIEEFNLPKTRKLVRESIFADRNWKFWKRAKVKNYPKSECVTADKPKRPEPKDPIVDE